MLDLLWQLFEHKDQLIQDATAIIASVVAFCAVLSTALPPASQPGAYATFRGLVNKIGQNYGHAKNASDTPNKPGTRPPFI